MKNHFKKFQSIFIPIMLGMILLSCNDSGLNGDDPTNGTNPADSGKGVSQTQAEKYGITYLYDETYLPKIHVEVTLDEWIDIAKYYSSPTSATFVNGVLDKIVSELTTSGRIKKSGRGLL